MNEILIDKEHQDLIDSVVESVLDGSPPEELTPEELFPDDYYCVSPPYPRDQDPFAIDFSNATTAGDFLDDHFTICEIFFMSRAISLDSRKMSII